MNEVLLEDERLRRVARVLPLRVKRPLKEWLFRASLRSSDVFLVGHPKSGNTWFAYMLAILLRGGDPEGRVTVANQGDVVPGIHGDDLDILRYRALLDPRVFRNEFPGLAHLYP